MRGKLVVGNWKMNGDLAANARLLDALKQGWSGGAGGEIAVCVPFPYLAQARERLAGSAIAYGAQDVSQHAAGAHTGEVSAAMVAEFGARYAIVGHSERRQAHRESDALVAAKAKAALGAGLTPIVCVGETLDERESGATVAVVGRQIDAAIVALGADMARCVVAYEPVWAIGTGRTASPEQAQEVHALLRSRLVAAGAADVKLLYGGSVKGANASALFRMPDVDGGLVGGASLDADEFLTIGAA
jgi:triosephosphate isomerase